MKRLIAFTLSIVLIFGLSAFGTSAADEKPFYLVLGDSINKALLKIKPPLADYSVNGGFLNIEFNHNTEKSALRFYRTDLHPIFDF